MKKAMLFVLAMIAVGSVQATETEVCEVQICNKIERFSLNIWSHMKDDMGEMCFNVIMPKSEAVEGKILDEQSRWYQGSSINITKKSVTRVKQVIRCL